MMSKQEESNIVFRRSLTHSFQLYKIVIMTLKCSYSILSVKRVMKGIFGTHLLISPLNVEKAPRIGLMDIYIVNNR